MKANLSRKISEAINELKIYLENKINGKLKKIYLYGSSVRDDFENDSDIDILILADITETESKELNKNLDVISAELSLKYNIVLSPILKNADTFFSYSKVMPFYKNIVSEGVVLYG